MLIQQEFYPVSHIPKPAFQTTLKGKRQILKGTENREFTLERTVNCATVHDRTLQSKQCDAIPYRVCCKYSLIIINKREAKTHSGYKNNKSAP